MEQRYLGNSGLRISRLALGCMSIGRRVPGFNDWAVDGDAAEEILKQALDLGITFWDTANIYGGGSSEEILGEAIGRLVKREDIVLATKLFYPVGSGPGQAGLSRRAIIEQVEESLRRLKTDWIDLYQIHRFDPNTPVEETMSTLHELVVAGKVRYLGASSMYAWQFAKMQSAAHVHGWTAFISMQSQYSLLQREEEREMFGLLADQNVAGIPWSPLAQGRLARPFRSRSHRFDVDSFGKKFFGDGDESIIDEVQKIAEERGESMAAVALAWVLQNPVVTSPLLGATSAEQLLQTAAALEIKLTDPEMAKLEKHYTPRQPTGF